ncbi:fungal trichothecene efflux pump [Dactylonectria estremocensis]|uniref:Fungal trichothecene efflux pump n=1 Tax=Dactylonectria estremocensis TaxID=1079267 RepID=A0A9P9DM61_9HYPO|nr:fungal trichothecene efflux pump [Dactylonectria estremocensis]
MVALDQSPPMSQKHEVDAYEARVEDVGDTGHSDSIDTPHSPPKMTPRRFMACTAMAFAWTSGQMPPYLWGAIPPIIYGDIGGTDRWVWFITANLICLAAICPFVGALSDILGRRYVVIMGSLFIILGQIICTTAHTMNVFICGMALSGVGAGINELTAIAGTAELAPTSQRGIYVAALIMTILPWCPSVLWAQLIAANSGWRYVGVLIIVYTALGLLVAVFFYFPPPRVVTSSLSRKEVFQRIDFVGGVTSVAGITLVVAAILWGGYTYSWRSVHVIAPLIIGVCTVAAFVCWEVWGAKYPMIPKNLGKAPRTLGLLLLISFISGANFFSVLMLWPTQAFNVYGHDPVAVGLRGLPFGLGVMLGCVITLGLMSRLRGRGIRWLLTAASCVMTAGCGALAAADLDNEKIVYPILLIAGLGVGGIVVPTSVITTIITPDEIIATMTSLTLSIRVIGGAIGYAIYYNILVQKLTPLLITRVSGAMVASGVQDPDTIEAAIGLTAASLIKGILALPGIDGNVTKWEAVVTAGQSAYADAYQWVYYCSIAFGGVSILASLFVGDIAQFMDDHIAVVI